MKNLWITFLLSLPLQMWGQKQVVIYREGKSPLRIDVEAVDSIRIEDALPEEHGAVDLGLSVLWASCNLGAVTPEGYGSYFAWGETEPKKTYTEENYVHRSGAGYLPLGNSIASSEYDVATKMWGKEWHIPTIEEIDELTQKCTWTWTAQEGVNGYRVTGPSGESIFLPAAGQWREDAMNVGSTGYYWSASASKDYQNAAYNLNFTGYNGRWSANRSYGFCIRPVRKDL